MELQQAQAQFQKAGLALAGITYDSVAILKDFASRKGITFPMLSDPDSAVIRAFGLLNAEATGYQKGIPHPGYFLLDTSGKVREKYFEASYLNGFTANSILARDFPELLEGVVKNVEAPHLKLALRQSDTTGIMGSRITLTAEITLPKNIHVYAPGATGGYIPTVLEVQPGPDYRLRDAHYPASKILYLRAIREKIPVFEGKFRITQDVVINSDREFMATVGNGKVVNIEGLLKYQACDAKICYPFKEVPVQWTFFVKPLDRQRVPEAIQHK